MTYTPMCFENSEDVFPQKKKKNQKKLIARPNILKDIFGNLQNDDRESEHHVVTRTHDRGNNKHCLFLTGIQR